MTVYESNEYISLFIIGILINIIGFAFYPPAIGKWTKRFVFAAIGYSIGILAVVQASLYSNIGSNDTWLNVGVPLIFMFAISLFYYAGAMMIGFFIFRFLAVFIFSWAIDYSWTTSTIGTMTIQFISFIGAIIFWIYISKASSPRSLILFTYCVCVCGINYLMYLVACTSNFKPYRLFDLNLQNPYRIRSCSPDASTPQELIVPFVLSFSIAFAGLLIQIISGFILYFIYDTYFSGKDSEEDLDVSIIPTTGKQRVLKELIRMTRSKKYQHSTWYYTRHKGEYVSFSKHERTLNEHLTEFGLKIRELSDSIEPDPSSQFSAAADQLKLIYQDSDFTGDKIRKEVVSWLRDPTNWKLLANYNNDLFGIKELNIEQNTYCDDMSKNETWGDFITLQAISQKYNIEINIVTSLEEPKIVQFPVIPQVQKKSILKTHTVKDVRALSPLASKTNKERYILIGSDGKEVLVDKFILEQSSVLARNIEEAKKNGTNKIQFFGSLTGKVLEQIVEQLEAHFLIKHNDRNPEIRSAYKELKIEGLFGDEIGEKQIDPPILLMGHYWGYHWCSLEKGIFKVGQSELPEDDPEWQKITQNTTRLLFIRVITILVLLSGLWWLLWLIIWGNNYSSFGAGLEFTLFFIAEFINYILGIVYNFNFWNSIRRKWKSLDRLNPPFNEELIANILISHYSEAAADTERTIYGSLRLKVTEKTVLKVWICDDGFWKPIPQEKPKTLMSTQNKPSFFQKIKSFFSKKKTEEVKAPLLEKSEKVEEGDEKKEKTKKFEEIDKILEGKKEVKEDEKDEELKKEEEKDEELKKEEEKELTDKEKEEKILKYIAERYKVEPKPLGIEMLNMIRKTIYRYYSEKNLERVDIGFDLRLTNEEDIVRSDCAKASLRYTFFAKKFGTNERIPGPEVILVGRIKPDFHHYKAGNHNNILFNEQMEGEFIVFLDNDMKPKPDFLLRTLPFFYYYHESSKRYEVNKGVAFLQSPQFFKDTTIAGESDFLGGRNSVFFQGIQHGRDGYDLCSFAGTNAIFRLPALHTIGGVPYGSLTEDAHTAIKLHQYGYRSVYVPDKLAVGIAPVTVANSLQQRARWCKGSVQLSLIYLFGFKIKEKEIPKWSKKNPFPIEERRQINYFNNYSFSKQATRNMFRKFFFVDTMAWPFSAVTAIFYMIVAFIFVVTAEAPISFLKTPLLYRAFLITFLPYFALRLIFQYLSYHGVNAQDVWVSQEIWFSYSFASVYGIIDALKEQITGKGLGGWGVTGEGTRSSKLEYPNVIVVFVLILVIIIRAILFAISSNRTPVEAASIFFAGTIIFQMWPVTSASIYEWINNAHLTPEDKVDLKRYEIPKYIIFAFLIIFFVIVGQLLG